MSNKVISSSYLLLKIPHDTTSGNILKVIEVSTIAAAVTILTNHNKDLANKESDHYFALIKGTVVPTSEWVPELQFIHYP